MLIYDIHNLAKIYPGQAQPANQKIDLQIHSGEIFGLLGDNGAGKTTLVRQMANLVQPTSGTIKFYGHDLGKDDLQVPLQVGYMPQDATAINNLKVGEALYFTAHLRGLSRAAAAQERDDLISLWGIESLRDKTGPQLSGGQRRLMQLAVAMAGRPPILILDEPTNDLDPLRRKTVWEILLRLNHEQGVTIIFVTHDAIEAEKIIERVGIMRDGELVALGQPAELKARVDRKLRLELFFSPETPPALPAMFPVHLTSPGRGLVYLDREDILLVLQNLDMRSIDDFRLYSATLEDLYLHYANQSPATPLPRPAL